MYTVKELIEDIKIRIGDTNCDLTTPIMLSFINKALRKLGRSKGLEKLFTYQESFELASLNADGTDASSWVLGDGTIDNTGTITDIKTLSILDQDSCSVFKADICYVLPSNFWEMFPVPESSSIGEPSYFTVDQYNGQTRITFDRPISRPFMISMVFTGFHPRLKTVNDQMKFPYDYIDILEDIVLIYVYREAGDFATALAMDEEVNFEIAELREQLARQKSFLGQRKIVGGISG